MLVARSASLRSQHGELSDSGPCKSFASFRAAFLRNSSRRAFLLRWRKEREGEGRPPTQAKLRDGQRFSRASLSWSASSLVVSSIQMLPVISVRVTYSAPP